MMRRTFQLAACAAVLLSLGSCGGGGGGGGGTPDPDGPIGVFSGVAAGFDFDWQSPGGGDGGVGAGGDGDGGVGAGGDFGQFRGALVRAFKQDGTKVGEAVTDDVNGMVTIKPGRTYKGSLCVELVGGVHNGVQATYYEEGKDAFVPFPAGRLIRVQLAKIDKNIGLTAFTEAAYRLLHGGANDNCATSRKSAAEIRAANDKVRQVLNQQFPTALEVDDITRLPFIKSKSLPQGTISTDPRGRYGLVNGAFSKQAAMFASTSNAPTLDALEQLAEDLIDGQLDGRRGAIPAVPADARTYDPNTLTGELSSALAQQAVRFGSQEALDALPRVLNFGNTRYEGYLFDGSIGKDGKARSTVAGWVAGNSLGRSLGDSEDKLPGIRAFSFYGNHGHGGAFIKSNSTGTPRLFAFGDNVNGELGIGSTSASPDVTEISLPGALTHAAGGFSHTVARLADGSVYTWGDNSFGQLGQGVGPSVLARSLTPRQVSLPAGALAVAATSVASYALLEDGRVFAWGSNGGFGLLGNGAAGGSRATPAAVPGLADVVQIAARDNDVVVLKADNTVWTWGSFPADATAFAVGDVAKAYEGGRLSPAQVTGLPATRKVRKVLTEQGLFVALIDDGRVYTWGVYFDITAGGILRDLTALRVLGLPRVRDMMPGGFNGYGVRAFDRMTAMGIDYRGGMWKIRGRVAEQFDPANPAQQRRPQVQSPRPDCINCHLYLTDWPLVPDPPTSAAVCDPYGRRPDIHGTRAASLIHAGTECEQCHNPTRNPPIAAFPDGWLACVTPTNLPQRTTLIDPPLITNSCALPLGHAFTPPGTVCATCHNSIIAQPLQEKNCAQPQPGELPTIRTTVTITGAFDDGGSAIAAGSITSDRTPELRGTIAGTLATGQAVRVLRDGSVLAGAASVSGSNWTFTDGGTAQGTRTYTARVQATTGGGFGPASNSLRFSVDSVTPTTAANVTAITDDALGAIANNGFASDTTPTVSGTLDVALDGATGETLELQRNGVAIAQLSPSGTTWTYTETAPLGAAGYTWRARVVDAAGNAAPFGTARSVTIVTGLPTASIAAIRNDSGGTIAAGSVTTDRTPALSGTLGAGLATGQVLRVLRNGASAGTASVTATSWTFTDNLSTDGSFSYTVRVEAGAVRGSASAAYAISVDSTAPTLAADVTGFADDFVGDLAPPATTADTTPTVKGSVAGFLASGESVRLMRSNGTSTVQVALVPAPGGSWSFTELSALAQGSYSYQAQVIDAAGNLGPLGTARSIAIDPSGVPLPGAQTTIVTVNGIAPSANAIPPSSDNTPTLAGTIQRALLTDEVVRVYRDGSPLNTPASVSGTGWTFADGALADGTYSYRAQVEKATNANVFGLTSASISVPIDTGVPTQTVSIVAIRDDANTAYADNGYTTDTTPLVQGSLGAALGAGEELHLFRNGVFVNAQSFAGTAWSYAEPLALIGAGSAANFSYTARVRDAAGNVGPISAARSINVVTNLSAATITSISGLADGALTNNTAPVVNITLSSPSTLPAGYLVRVLRNGSSVGTLGTCNTTCAFNDSVSTDTTYTYTARTEVGGTAIGLTSNSRSITLDTTAPELPTIALTVNNKPYQNNTTDSDVTFNSNPGVTIGDPTPLMTVSFSSLAGTGDTVALDKWNGSAWVEVATTTSGTTLGFTQPATFNGVGAAPSGNPGTQFYRARRTDPVGNVATTAFFQFANNYLACSQTRALAKSNNTTHADNAVWVSGSGIGRCTGCHVPPVAGVNGFIATPPLPPTGSGIDRHWCSKN